MTEIILITFLILSLILNLYFIKKYKKLLDNNNLTSAISYNSILCDMTCIRNRNTQENLSDFAKTNELTNYILGYCLRNGVRDCTHKKLQKLLYYVYSWFYVEKDEELIKEPFFAWLHGPVLKSVFEKFNNYNNEPISLEKEYKKDSDNLAFDDKELKKRELINEIIEGYIECSGDELENLTHIDEPWKKARDRGIDGTEKINKNEIKAFYTQVKNNNNYEATK